MFRLPAKLNFKYPGKRSLGFFAFFVFLLCILSSIKSDHLKQFSYDLKGSIYHFFRIPTDMTVYASEKDNVLRYSSIHLKYVISNSEKCNNLEPFILIFVKTHPNNFEERKIIRDTWGDIASWSQIDKDHQVLVLFVLGVSKSQTRTLQEKVEEENTVYGDLIQVDFLEDFHNLTLKLVSHLKWPIKYCRKAKFWMTTDDDVFVNVGNLVTHLMEIQPKMVYTGLLHTGTPRKVVKFSKYYVPYNVYHGAYFPDYFPGAGYVLSMDAVEKLFANVHKLPMLYIDDAYVGILADISGVPAKHYFMFRGEQTASTDLCTLSKFITSHKHVGIGMVKFFEMIMSLKNLDPNVLCWGKFFSWVNPSDLVYY